MVKTHRVDQLVDGGTLPIRLTSPRVVDIERHVSRLHRSPVIPVAAAINDVGLTSQGWVEHCCPDSVLGFAAPNINIRSLLIESSHRLRERGSILLSWVCRRLLLEEHDITRPSRTAAEAPEVVCPRYINRG